MTVKQLIDALQATPELRCCHDLPVKLVAATFQGPDFISDIEPAGITFDEKDNTVHILLAKVIDLPMDPHRMRGG
jgi:hypothetical protein